MIEKWQPNGVQCSKTAVLVATEHGLKEMIWGSVHIILGQGCKHDETRQDKNSCGM